MAIGISTNNSAPVGPGKGVLSDDIEAILAAARPTRDDKPQRLQKVRYSHEAMADMIVSNPGITQREIAAMFGKTESWVSIIFNSDAFRAFLAARKEALVDPMIQISLQEKFFAVANKSVEVLMEKLSKPADQIDDKFALRAAELGAKANNVGGMNQPPPLHPDHLNTLADRLLSLQSNVRRISHVDLIEEVSVRTVPADSGQPDQAAQATGNAQGQAGQVIPGAEG